VSAEDAPPVAVRGAARRCGLVHAAQCWVAFWDEREPPTCLALIRMLLGVAVLFDLATLALHGATTWLWAPAEAGGAAAWDAADPPLLVRVVAPTAAGAWALWGGLALSALCLTVGFRTRVAALAHVFFSVQAALINSPADRAIDRLIRIVLLILVLSPAGRVWSLDARLETGSFRGDLAPRAAWPRYLIVTQLVITYFGAGLAKGGTHWYPWGGYNALYLTLQDPIFSVVAGAPWLEQPVPYFATRVATAVTHLWELAAPLVLLAAHYRRTADRPGRIRRAFNRFPVRNVYVVLGIVFHLSLAAVLRLGIFPFAMLACFPAFFQPRELERAFGWMRGSWRMPSARPTRQSSVIADE
jgi:hypothetical protein